MGQVEKREELPEGWGGARQQRGLAGADLQVWAAWWGHESLACLEHMADTLEAT